MIAADRSSRVLAVLVLLLAGCFFAPAAVQAAELYTFTGSLLGGLGGSLDADPGDDLGNTGFQLGLSMVVDTSTHLGLRLGQLDLDGDGAFGSLASADLTYATIGGEYRFRESFYESGIYVGLGAYRLDGDRFDGTSGDESTIGVVVGVTGEFELGRDFGFVVELSGHYADFDEAQLFLMGHAGIAYHF